MIQPLARRPVNVNTASPLVLKALFHNLKLAGASARITSSEANELVQVVMESRPFTGFEDFVRRVVLPAGGFEELPADAPYIIDHRGVEGRRWCREGGDWVEDDHAFLNIYADLS